MYKTLFTTVAKKVFQEQAKSNGWMIAAGALGVTGLIDMKKTKENAKCCGIVGVVATKHNKNPDARSLLLEGLSIIQNRGYDSAGIATSSDGDLFVSKYASKGSTSDSIDLLKDNSSKHENHSIGLGHTRWATHGGKTDQNSHPHVDFSGRIALVHNGTISNYLTLREGLEKRGIHFKSETDSEVIAHLIGVELHEDETCTLKEAVAKVVLVLEGTWGLAILDKKKPGEIVVVRNGSPMVIGLGVDNIFIASETAAFNKHTKNFIPLEDGEVAVISPIEFSLDMSRIEQAPDHGIELHPGGGHPHWTIYEIMSQPDAITRALSFGGRITDNSGIALGGLDQNKETMRGIKNLLFTGSGTSQFASIYGAKLMRELGAFDTCQSMDSAEIQPHDIPHKDGGVLAVSQSGESRDVLVSLKKAQQTGVPCLSVVNVVSSAIARETGVGVYVNAGRENAVASTKSFSGQITVLSLMAIWFRKLREEDETVRPGMLDTKGLIESLRRLPVAFSAALELRDQCKEIAKTLVSKNNCFILGKGFGEPVAFESALKLKEMTYLHAEGYSGGALKHGTMALLEDKDGPFGATRVFAFVLDDEHSNQMRTACIESKTRGASVKIITDNPKLAEGIDSDPIVIPSNGKLTALVGVVPMQLIAYELALLKGIDVDTPRNLAKCVTVE